MKNSKEYAQRLQKLYRGLKRAQPKVEKVAYDDPAEALICGIIHERLHESAAHRAIKGIRSAFVDWNDLRVSRVEEVVEALGEDSPASRAAATSLTSALKDIFDEYHKVSLQALKVQGKRPARQCLERFEGVSRFVVNYCLLTALQAVWVGLGLFVVLPRLLSAEAWDVLRPSPVFALGLAAGAIVFGFLTVTEAIPQIVALFG